MPLGNIKANSFTPASQSFPDQDQPMKQPEAITPRLAAHSVSLASEPEKNIEDESIDRPNRDITERLAHHKPEECIKFREKITSADHEYRNNLFQACRRGDVDFVKTMIKKGLNVNHECNGYTLLMFAADLGNLEIVKIIYDNEKNLEFRDIK